MHATAFLLASRLHCAVLFAQGAWLAQPTTMDPLAGPDPVAGHAVDNTHSVPLVPLVPCAVCRAGAVCVCRVPCVVCYVVCVWCVVCQRVCGMWCVVCLVYRSLPCSKASLSARL